MNTSIIKALPPLPSVIAHRGASAYAPENTAASFRKAIEMGADWIELDCHLTRDGKLAVMHDRDTSRFNNKQVPVVEMNMADLRQVDVGSWFSPEFAGERIHALEEIFELTEGRVGVYVELKSAADETPRIPDMLEVVEESEELTRNDWKHLLAAANRISADSVIMAQRVIELMREWQDRCAIVAQSFSPIMAAIFRYEAPDLRFEFLGMDLDEPPNIWRDYIRLGERIGVHGFNFNKESMTPERVRYFHAQGYSCAIWVVDEPEHIQRCADLGVDAIITNKPDICLRELGRSNLFATS